MNTFVPLASDRLKFTHGKNYTTIEELPVKLRAIPRRITSTAVLTGTFVYCTLTLWEYPRIPNSFSEWVVAVLWVWITILTMLSWLTLLRTMFLRDKLTLTKSLLTFERTGMFRTKTLHFDPIAIEALQVVPKYFSRPFAGFPYRSTHSKLRLKHAGEERDLFLGLDHGAVLSVAASCLPYTNGLQLEDFRTTPGAEATNNHVYELNSPEKKKSPSLESNHLRYTLEESQVQWVLKPRFNRGGGRSDLVFFLLCGALLFSRQASQEAELLQYVLVVALVLQTPTFFWQLFSELLRKELVLISGKTLEHQIKLPFRLETRFYSLKNVSKPAVTYTGQKYLDESDFKEKSVFSVAFDYGQNIRELGYQMTYAEAKHLADTLSEHLQKWRQAA